MSSKNPTPSASVGALADWYGWVESPDTPGAAIANVVQAKPPREQKIKLAPGQSVIGLLPQARVAAGQTASAEVPLVSTSIDAATLRVLLIRNGTDTTSTDFKSFVKVGSAAQAAKVAGKFPIAYASLRIELKNTGTTAVEFIAGKPIVRIGW